MLFLNMIFHVQIFLDFNPVPIASASLAQVHVAHTHDGRKVAVKVLFFSTLNFNKREYVWWQTIPICFIQLVSFILCKQRKLHPKFDF